MTRTVDITTISASPSGVRKVITRETLPTAEAARLVHAKRAEYAAEQPVETADLPAPRRGKGAQGSKR